MERQLPKNVRQIGNVSDSSKIYVEDYVDTFLNQLWEKTQQEVKGAFLIGEKVQEEEQTYIYIYGAIHMQNLKMKEKELILEESVWKNACETCKEYFEEAEILGWFVSGGENQIEVNYNVKKMHQKYFQREETVFVTKTAREKEEQFYIYKYNDLLECGGHFVYYEKNLQMQNYMISCRKEAGITPSEVIEDRAAKNFRNIIHEKMEKDERKSKSKLVYAMSTLLVLVVVVIGVTMLDNYEKMKRVQESLNLITETVSKQDTIETDGQIVQQEEVDTEVEEQEEETKEGTIQSEEVYIVEEGDTLVIISQKIYGDSVYVEEICKANGLEDGNLIFVGQKLLLPERESMLY